jgi:hypothetical protein
MKFICAQPAIDYYSWQVEVMLNNFISNNVNPDDIHIVCAHYGNISDKWKKLTEKFDQVNFFFYPDDRMKAGYISSIRPHLLYKHWLATPSLQSEVVFYHDCDIALSKPLDVEDILKDNISYVSDTVSYIGANYIRSKGEHYLDLMSRIVNVDKNVIISQEANSGGAQYLFKNIPTEFWKKVYYDAENLYRLVNDQIAKDKAVDPKIHEIQIWCADMWAVLWNLWFFNKQVKVTEKLSFSWATSHIGEWDKNPIYHNAGVTANRKELFYKGQYINKLPYDEIKQENIDDRFCSYNYVKELLKTKEVTCLK